jgi:hypothetical protein
VVTGDYSVISKMAGGSSRSGLLISARRAEE